MTKINPDDFDPYPGNFLKVDLDDLAHQRNTVI